MCLNYATFHQNSRAANRGPDWYSQGDKRHKQNDGYVNVPTKLYRSRSLIKQRLTLVDWLASLEGDEIHIYLAISTTQRYIGIKSKKLSNAIALLQTLQRLK